MLVLLVLLVAACGGEADVAAAPAPSSEGAVLAGVGFEVHQEPG